MLEAFQRKRKSSFFIIDCSETSLSSGCSEEQITWRATHRLFLIFLSPLSHASTNLLVSAFHWFLFSSLLDGKSNLCWLIYFQKPIISCLHQSFIWFFVQIACSILVGLLWWRKSMRVGGLETALSKLCWDAQDDYLHEGSCHWNRPGFHLILMATVS